LSIFNDLVEFENWLQGQPREVLTMLAARAALRVLPFAQMAKHEDYRGRLVLPLFCAGSVAWSAAKYPALETDLAARAAAALLAAFANRAMAARLQPFLSPEIFFAHRFANASDDEARAALLSAMRGKNGAAAAIQRDAAAKANGKFVPDILARKLWPGTRPRWIAELWKELKQDLLAAQEDWDVWTDWYEARLQGNAYYEESETARLWIAEENWEQGPRIVNREIKGFLGRQIPNQRGEKKRAPSAPGVPPPRPAALEPVWMGGRLGLLPQAAESDSGAVVHVMALNLLREEIVCIAAAAEGERAVDLRSIACLRGIAARIPTFSPSQNDLFYLAHMKEFLKAYADTVNDNWPAYLAARFAALILRFDQTVQQFPKWRDFVSNAEQDQLSLEQAAEVSVLADAVIAALREEEARNFIDPAILSALEIFQAPLQIDVTRQRQQTAGPTEASMLLLANDLLTSIDNITKRIAEAALEIKNLSGSDRDAVFANEALTWGNRDAGDAYLWMTQILSRIAESTPAGVLHSKFCWLKPLTGLAGPHPKKSPAAYSLEGQTACEGERFSKAR
jgi:hypothetical protein